MRQELVELKNILNLMKKMKLLIEQQKNDADELILEVKNSVEDVNTEVYGCRHIPEVSFDNCGNDTEDFINRLDNWLSILEKELCCRETISNKTDYNFRVFSARVQAMSEEELVQESIKYLTKLKQENPQHYEAIRLSYNMYHYFWGSVDLDNGNIELIKNRVHEMKSHWDDFCWLYENLEDYRSKKVLCGILNHWITFDFVARNSIKENNYDDYFDYDMFCCGDDEVFVDLGAWNGDSALSFIENYGNYKRIYCYEMTHQSLEEAKQKLADYDNIVYRQVAVGDTNGTVKMDSYDDSSSNVITDKGKVEIPMVRIDDDISEPITFIKMDIEGSEIEAMKGAREHICNDKPKLAVCTYHNNHHIYEVPKLMKEYNPDYKLYMRYNGNLNSALVSEFVTFAL